MAVKIIPQTDLEYSSKILLDKGIVLLPTETVFGVAVIFDCKEAVDRLRRLKNRPDEKAFPLAVCSYEQIEQVCYLDERLRKIVHALLPGPVTLVLPMKDNLPDYIGSNHTVAIRYSDNAYITKLISRINKPLLLTSANRSGELPFVSIEQAVRIFGDHVGAYVDGKVTFGKASTILDVTKETPIIVREGPLKMDKILDCLKGI